jgi:hypothetical protein
MHKFKFSLTGLAAATATVGLALVLSTSAMAAQTVNPSSAPTGGTNFAGTTQPVASNGSFTFYGVYSDDSATPESGLGLKVKYDATKVNVVLSEEYTKCRIAPAQQQAAGATSQWVLGFIDTSIRPSGAVGWPDLADTAAGGATAACLNASGNTDTAAASATGLKLFKGVVSWVGTPTVGATAAITLDAEGNFSYANASPSFANKSFTVQAAAPTACNLDVDGTASATAFRDGVMIFRYMANIRSSSLIANINSPVPNAVTVEANVAALLPSLNIKGTPAATQLAFVDGLLLFRVMAGINGPALVSGINFPTGSTRTTSQQIIGYINATCGTSYANP